MKPEDRLPHITTDKIFSRQDLEEACARVSSIKDDEIAGIFEEIRAIQNPYAEDIFPRDHVWAGKIMRDKGLRDNEISGISGAVGRLAFEWIMAEIDRLLNTD